MNRNGSLKVIKARMDSLDYPLEQALLDLKYVIDYAEGLEEDFRELQEQRDWESLL